MIAIERSSKFGGTNCKKAVIAQEPIAGRVLRSSKIMPLAIGFDRLIRDSVVKDQVELARLGHLRRRVSVTFVG